ncbi:GtrA family protein [Spiribacter aquaticus]|uniref:GtrA family protein n=2 Tax=Spiribacter TaxID=1335745 RepID=A0A557RGM7_9GAMM|nr:GtrA family protein [Spiribacter aquaticus]
MGTRPMLRKLATEGLITLRFGLVGMLATLIHAGVVTLLIEITPLDPRVANAIAFGIAFIVSFNGHFHWTFPKEAPTRQAMRRFFVIALLGFGMNTLLLSVLLKEAVMSETIAALVSILAIPATTLLAARLWGFRA